MTTSWLLVAMVIVLLLEGVLIIRITVLIGGWRTLVGDVRNVVRRNRAPRVDEPSPAVSCHLVLPNRAGKRVSIAAKPDSILVYAGSRSVAGRRVIEIFTRLSGCLVCPVEWTWLVGGRRREVVRLVEATNLYGRALEVTERELARCDASGVPLALYVDEQRKIRHTGRVRDLASLAAFIEGCPHVPLRAWMRQAVTASKLE